MSKISFEEQLKSTTEKIQKVQETRENVFSKIQEAEQKLDNQGQDALKDLDFAKSSLESVQVEATELDANIATLINALDDITSEIGSDFNVMREKTGWEKVTGIFSSKYSDSIRIDRIRNSSITEKLNDIIVKSNAIEKILIDQLVVLKGEYENVKTTLDTTLQERVGTTKSLDEVREALAEVNPVLEDLYNQIQESTDSTVRTELEKEMQVHENKRQELENEEQTLLSQSQEYERYIEIGKGYVESIHKQISTQNVLINKLKTDTEKRTVYYQATGHSIKTAEQQNIGHKINELAVDTDEKAFQIVNGIGHAANNKMIEMLESQEQHMARLAEVHKKSRMANDIFSRRFETVIDKHEGASYEL
jgi:chromosome segregation ATPase